MESEFNGEEIRAAFWGLDVDKTPEPDGFPLLFFREFWKDVKVDLTRLLHEFHTGVAKLERINMPQVVLLPKKESLNEIEDFRPIALLNTSLRSLSKLGLTD